jgi:glc operon protein GlcG
MSEFGLTQARHLAEQAMAQAGARFNKPICVAIVDHAGFLLAFARQDGAPLRSIQISEGKAYSAARMGVTTQAFYERLQREQIEARYFCDEKLTALAGGAPLKNAAGKLVGAAGISGLTSAEDQEIANLLAEMVAKS